MTSYTINLDAVVEMTDEQFFHFCRSNPDLKFDRSSRGDLVIMPPTGGETDSRKVNLERKG